MYNFTITSYAVALGCIYGLVALGVAMIWSAVRTLNFAQADIMMLGAYLAYTALTILGVPFWLAFLFMTVCILAFGVIFQRVAYYPLRDRPFILVVVSTIGVSIFLRNMAQNIWGNAPVFFPQMFTGVVRIGRVALMPQNIFIILVMTILMISLYLLLNKTKLGKMLRATSQDQEAAQLMGIKTQTMIATTFAISSFLAGAAGLLIGPIFFVEPYMGATISTRAFIATVIGGFGSIPGAVVGGIIVGIIEVFSAAFISSTYKDVIVFSVCVLFLIFRPTGIFGETVGEKA